MENRSTPNPSSSDSHENSAFRTKRYECQSLNPAKSISTIPDGNIGVSDITLDKHIDQIPVTSPILGRLDFRRPIVNLFKGLSLSIKEEGHDEESEHHMPGSWVDHSDKENVSSDPSPVTQGCQEANKAFSHKTTTSTSDNLPTNFTRRPVVLTAQPQRVSTDPLTFVDPLDKAPTPDTLSRKVSTRPPPSTPPEPATHDQLSMPTLPSLHLASTPALIEQYRHERRLDPLSFDQTTTTIQANLVRAKIERGGLPFLLLNEFTAELASRLDAQAIESWSAVRYGSDDEDEDEEDGEDASDPVLAMRLSAAESGGF